MKIHELLAEPAAWTRGQRGRSIGTARTATGQLVLSEDPKACCWSLQGAIERCYPGTADQMAVELWDMGEEEEHPVMRRIAEAIQERDRLMQEAGDGIDKGRLSPRHVAVVILTWNDMHYVTHEDVLSLVRDLDV